VLALLTNKEPKPKQLITIRLKDYRKYENILKDALTSSLEFLQNDLGVFSKNIAYTSMLVPLVAMFAFLIAGKHQEELRSRLRNHEDLILKYIKQWYFLNVFTERYDEGAATKTYQDYKNFTEFINIILRKGRSAEDKIKDLIGIESINLQELQRPKAKNSALLKGFISLLILNSIKDFKTEISLNALNSTDEHIFPKKFFNSDPRKADVVLNRTLSAPETNKFLKRWQKPSDFFKRLEEEKGVTRLKEILRSHFIEEEALEALKRDDFDKFTEARLKSIKEFVIEKELIPTDLI
jgi:hypothetical protein